jgi:acetyltransferase-like isoleucine patch superfamily enzyme
MGSEPLRPELLDPFGAPFRTQLRLVGSSLAEDLSAAVRHVVVNRIAGSVLVPRALRYVLLRLARYDIRTPNIFPGSWFTGRHLRIGRGTFINHDCYFEGVAPIEIGEECQIAPQVMILTSYHPFMADGRFARLPQGKPVTVGQRVWLGARCTLLPGVTIGDDVVIAAGAVVTRDCLAPGIYAGTPARLLRPIAGPSGRECAP